MKIISNEIIKILEAKLTWTLSISCILHILQYRKYYNIDYCDD